MNQTEVKLMAMRLEREIELKRHLEEGRIRRELDTAQGRADRPSRGGILQWAWHVASGVPHSRWTWLEHRRRERGPAVAAADTLVMEGSRGR